MVITRARESVEKKGTAAADLPGALRYIAKTVKKNLSHTARGDSEKWGKAFFGHELEHRSGRGRGEDCLV